MLESIAKSIQALDNIELKQLDESISWMEETLHVLRTLRAVKAISEANKPRLIKEWESAVDLDRRLQYGERNVKPELIKAFQNAGSNVIMTVEELSIVTKITKERVYSGLNNHKDTTFRQVPTGKHKESAWQLIVAEISGQVA